MRFSRTVFVTAISLLVLLQYPPVTFAAGISATLEDFRAAAYRKYWMLRFKLGELGVWVIEETAQKNYEDYLSQNRENQVAERSEGQNNLFPTSTLPTTPLPYADDPIQSRIRAGARADSHAIYLSPVSIEVYSSAMSMKNDFGDLGTERNHGVVRQMPGISGTDYTVGALARADLSRPLDLAVNQALFFTGQVEHHWGKTNSGPDIGFPFGTGSVTDEDWVFTAAVDYWFSHSYLSGRAILDEGTSTISTTATGGLGNSDSHSYDLGATLGHFFTLWSAPSIPASRFAPVIPNRKIVTKAPRIITEGPAQFGWQALFLDVNGHIDHTKIHFDPFTDTSNFPFGDQNLSATTAGVTARLVARYVAPTFVAEPYVGVTFDKISNFSHVMTLPPSTLVSETDAVNFTMARDVTQIEAGIASVLNPNLVLSGSIYHITTSDTKITGGVVSISLPFL